MVSGRGPVGDCLPTRTRHNPRRRSRTELVDPRPKTYGHEQAGERGARAESSGAATARVSSRDEATPPSFDRGSPMARSTVSGGQGERKRRRRKG